MPLATATLIAAASVVATHAVSAAGTASTIASSVPTGTVEALETLVQTAVPSALASALPSGLTTTAPLAATQVLVPAYFEIAAAFAGGLAGAATAVRKRFDLTGLLTLTLVTGMGGGIIRDVLLQKYGIYAFQNPRMLYAILAAAVLGFFFRTLPVKLRWAMFALDTVSLALFTIIGVDKALRAGLTVVPAIMLGLITGVGGGIIRDILSDDVPQVLKPGSFYALAAFVGTTAYVTLGEWLHLVKPIAVGVAVTLIIGLRLLSVWRGWTTPEPVDLTPSMTRVPRALLREGRRMSQRRRNRGTEPNRTRSALFARVRELPKAELHMHLEGSMEPELMLELAQRNNVRLRFTSAEEVRAAYEFTDLQSFLDIYYEGASVLLTEHDFHDLTLAYLRRANIAGVRHVEVFFDPQTHTSRGVAFATVIDGIVSALSEGERDFGISWRLIMCFLRHLPESEAFATLEHAMAHADVITAVGLDSSEFGNPPEKFARVFAAAREAGFLTVAHAGEEGPPSYITDSLDLLGVSRIDHGVRCLEDPALVDRLVRERVPLTVCPLSNVKLRVVERIEDHPLAQMLAAGLCVTVNSDDPAYFGGYVDDNFVAIAEGLELKDAQLVQLARNSLTGSFLPQERIAELVRELETMS